MKKFFVLKIVLISVVLTFLVWPALLLAQEAATTTPESSAAENIDVELKVPLPFVKTKTKTVPDDIDPAKTKTIRVVSDLKDYIEGLYRFLIGAGALFAVVMIIIAGYQWMFSGGSSDKTGAAKKRMWNASIGLVLALLSYVILNAISARLVELRLPKVAPVQPFFGTPGLFCGTDPAIKAKRDKAPDPAHFLFEVGNSNEVGIDLENAACGKRYNVGDPNGQFGQCLGNVCLTNGRPDPNKTCVDGQCSLAMVYGEISWRPDNGYVDYIRAYPICDNERGSEVGAVDVPEKGGAYKLIAKTENIVGVSEFSGESSGPSAREAPSYKVAAEKCGPERFKGFVLKVEVNNDCYTGGTKDSDYAIGKNCGEPIHPDGKYDFGSIKWEKVTKEELIHLDDIGAGAYNCNLVIDRAKFPVIRLRGVKGSPKDSCPTYD